MDETTTFSTLTAPTNKLTCAAALRVVSSTDRPPRTLRNARDAGWRRAPPRPPSRSRRRRDAIAPPRVATPASPRDRRGVGTRSRASRSGHLRPRSARADDDASPVPPPEPRRRPAACVAGASCVSTSSFRTPANYLPPWEYLESDADAFDRLLRALDEDDAANVLVADADRGVVAAALTTRDGVDDYEFFFTNDGGKTVLFRAQSRVARASPPGCFVPGCINGPAVRRRADALRERLGWLALETDEEKQWVPLLLH